MEKEKTAGQLLEEKLLNKKVSCYETFAAENMGAKDVYVQRYMQFLNGAKTEREFVTQSVDVLEHAGFVPFDPKKEYEAGDKIYYNVRGRALIAAVIGEKALEEGVRIVAAHIDSPRLDLKPNPIYESEELGYFKTHYYGGIKKYQWSAIPLAIHGTILKADGERVDVVLGEGEADPVFCVSDLLPHLSHKAQNNRPATEIIRGEELNILIGSEPFADSAVKNPVKLNLLKLLNEKYGIVEADFVSAELEVVPAFKARYIGFDKSLVGAYGHDDRVCGYTGLTALMDTPNPAHTAICVLADKEETGSEGNTGLNSDMLRNFLALLSRSAGIVPELVCANSKCLSADVNAALDPTFSEVHEKLNAARLNYGPVLTKYTGARGKSSTNDASAEMMSFVRGLLDGKNVPWQTGELGKVDEGGGGTVAKFVSHLDIDTVDIGVALLSMHAPYEVASALDIFATYKAFCAFFE